VGTKPVTTGLGDAATRRGISAERRFSIWLLDPRLQHADGVQQYDGPMLELSFLTRSKLAFGRISFNLSGQSSKGTASENCVATIGNKAAVTLTTLSACRVAWTIMPGSARRNRRLPTATSWRKVTQQIS